MIKTKIKLNDDVIVIAGSETGKIGKVLAILKKKQRVIVENLNLGIKHLKPKKGKTSEKNVKGSLKKIEFPIHISNVMIYDKINKKGSRIGLLIKDTKKLRYLKNTDEIIE